VSLGAKEPLVTWATFPCALVIAFTITAGWGFEVVGTGGYLMVPAT